MQTKQKWDFHVSYFDCIVTKSEQAYKQGPSSQGHVLLSHFLTASCMEQDPACFGTELLLVNLTQVLCLDCDLKAALNSIWKLLECCQYNKADLVSGQAHEEIGCSLALRKGI